MWSRIVLSSACAGLILQALAGVAQDSQTPTVVEPDLLARTPWVRLEVIGGRIAVFADRCGQIRSPRSERGNTTEGAGDASAGAKPAEVARENLSVQLRGGLLVLNYVAHEPHQRRELRIEDDGTLRITHTQTVDPPREVSLQQPLTGRLTLQVTSGGAQQQTSAPSLWHLLLAEPELCAQHLTPLLESLKTDWRLTEQAENLRETLLAAAGSDVLAERAQWTAWVQQLASSDFQQRQAAERALRGVGQPVIAWLARLEVDDLDSEQRQRIRRISSSLADASRDTPPRVAPWLIDDKAVWLAIIARGELDERIAAADHLSKLCRRTIPFDPHAPQDQRRLQMAELMTRYSE